MGQVFWWQAIVIITLLSLQTPKKPGAELWLPVGIMQAKGGFDPLRFLACVIVIEVVSTLIKDNERIRFGYFEAWMHHTMNGVDPKETEVLSKEYMQEVKDKFITLEKGGEAQSAKRCTYLLVQNDELRMKDL